VVPRRNAEELRKGIQLLLDNPRLREEMGEAGRWRVERHFTSTKMAEAMLEVYREMLQEPHRAGVPAKHPQAEEAVEYPAKWA
jgi:glycosyltransferase involved in cell wall biosynthesis